MPKSYEVIILGPTDPSIKPNTFPAARRVWIVDENRTHANGILDYSGETPEGSVIVAQSPTWDNGNVYDPDTEIAIVTGTFTGGLGDVTYRWRWQWEIYGTASWTSGGWTGYLNTREGLQWDIPKEAQHGKIRLQCQAVDVYEDDEGATVSRNTNNFSSAKTVSELPPFKVVTKGRIDQFIEPGGTYTCVPAIWEGGTDESTYRARWEWKATPSSTWQYGEFEEYENNALLAEVSFTVPLEAGGGTVRIQSQARDPYVSGSNDRSNEVEVARGAVTVGDFFLTGLPYVGQTITAYTPLVIGGIPPYNILYDFGNGTQQSETYEVRSEDVNKMISCMVTAIDTNFDSDSRASGNQIGNIQPALSLEPATTTINGEVLDPDESVPARNDTTYAIVCTPFEYPNDFDISASMRNSSGTLEQNPILSEEFTYTPGADDMFATMVVMMTSQIAGDYTYNVFFDFTSKSALEIGNLACTINDLDYDLDTSPTLTILINDPIIVILDHDGDASPEVTWTPFNNYPVLISEQVEHVVMTFTQEGVANVTCELKDDAASDSPKSVALNFYVVDAKEWAALHPEDPGSHEPIIVPV